MKKRLLSFALALVLVLSAFAMSACQKDTPRPPVSSGDDQNNDTKNPASTTPAATEPTAPETNADGLLAEYFDKYVRDDNAKYLGKVGVGGKGANFDNLIVLLDANSTMYENDFESETALNENIFSTYGGAVSDWVIGDDSVTEGNKKLFYTGSDDSKLTFGNTEWGPYRFNYSFALDEGGEAEIYFCVKDENNYYVLTIADNAEKGIAVAEVKDGKKTEISHLNTTPAKVGEWIPASVNVTRTEIVIYIGGVSYFKISDDLADHVYSGLVGFGQWQTEFYIDNVKIEDLTTGEIIYSQDFEDGTFMDTVSFALRNGGIWTPIDNSKGDWEVIELSDGNHVLHFKDSGTYGAAILFDPQLPDGCTSYKFTYEGYKVKGNEGYPAIWDWHEGDKYTCFNLGGWSGETAFQIITGPDSSQKENIRNNAKVGLETGEWQTVELYMYPECIYAFFHGDFIQLYWHKS